MIKKEMPLGLAEALKNTKGRWDKRLNSRIKRGREVLHLVSRNLGNPTSEKRLKTRSFGLDSAS